MLVTKTKAAALAGISRRTFYNHIPLKRISVVRDDDGTDKVELSELERVYGKEVVSRNLLRLEEGGLGGEGGGGEGGEGGVQPREGTHAPAQPHALPELLLLKERLRGLEEQKTQLESHQRRERDQYQEEIAALRESLRRAQEHHAQLTLLLSDQTAGQRDDDEREEAEGKEGREIEHERKLQELEQTVRALKRMNLKVLRELRTERSKSLWHWLFGLGPDTTPSLGSPPNRTRNGAGH